MQVTKWDQVLSTELTNDFCHALGKLFADRIADKTTRKRLRSCMRDRDYRALCDFPVDYAYLGATDASAVRQVLALFTKREDLDIGADKERVAVDKWVQAERFCAAQNEAFRQHGLGKSVFPVRIANAFDRAAKKIADVLGRVPEKADFKVCFGPGSTTQIKKEEACVSIKLDATPCCGRNFSVRSLGGWLETMPAYTDLHTDLEGFVDFEVHDARLEFVPKSAKTYRAICVEPAFNGLVQLGIGKYIADRLRRVGVDITDQERNKTLARLGSIHGGLATLDLSSASDTISQGLVSYLLPVDWYLLLSEVTSSHVSYKGYSLALQKFSSMGNGFTFPLETLIFWALVTSIDECDYSWKSGDISVYGDDIIVPQHDVEGALSMLSWAGFVINHDKSFWTGPFRESCGGDYYVGTDITPVFLKDRLSTELLFKFHNAFVERGDAEAASLVLDYIGEEVRLWGPAGFGDGHLVGAWHPWPCKPSPFFLEARNGWAGVTFQTYAWKPKRDKTSRASDHATALYQIYAREGASDADLTRLSDVGTPTTVEGTPISALPGKQRYKKISIYTFI